MIGISVEGSHGPTGYRWDEIERINIYPRAGGQAGGISAVLEIHPLGNGATRCTKPPLFAGVTDVQRVDRATRIVLKRGPENGYQASAAQLAQRAICRQGC